MKKNLLFLLTIVWALSSCQKENDDNQASSGQVEFSFEQKAETYTKAGEAGTPAAIVVSVEDLNGNKIFNAKSIELLNMNGSYITKPVTLVTGNYKITSYMVVDGANNVMYTVPLEGSKYAYLVNDPLPVSFSVAHNGYAKLSPQVLSTKEHKPEDFGYPSFSMDSVNTFDFLVATFAYDDSTQLYKLIPANIEITYANFSYAKNLPAATDTITLINTNADYIVTIRSQGFKDWADTLTAAELKLYFSSHDMGPLKVFMNKCNCLSTVTDIDGNIYHTVKIGNQVWLAENLKVTRYRNGDLIGTTVPATLITFYESSPKYQWAYNGDESKVAEYGRLYTWYAATDSRNICPVGFHLPSDDEWTQLITYLGGESVAGGKLKEIGTSHWRSPNTGATNETCFTAVPSGSRYNYGTFETGTCCFWSATESDATNAWYRYMNYFYSNVYKNGFNKGTGFPVRCLRD